MFLGIDDTDGPDGMCTTYLMTLAAERFSSYVEDYPRLVRLNPNIPFRTRGNGALSLQLDRGRKRFTIGYVNGEPIVAGVVEPEPDLEKKILEFWKIVKKYSSRDANTNPGMVLAQERDGGTFYELAVKGVVDRIFANNYIGRFSSRIFSLGNGRGTIGAFASISWPSERVTYEVLAYQYPHPEPVPRDVMFSIADYADSFDFTFDNVDHRNRRATIFPSPRTPIIYGIRGTDPEKLLSLSLDINERFNLPVQRVFVFKTNQATDDHLIPYAGELRDLSSYTVQGVISENPHYIRGGHYFSSLSTLGRTIKLAAFEPTKEFRRIFSGLCPGDEVVVSGSYIRGTLNVEKLSVLSTSKVYIKTPPVCPQCGSRMDTRGAFDYTCGSCGSRSHLPAYVPLERKISPGDYTVPVCARRHLSAPLPREVLKR